MMDNTLVKSKPVTRKQYHRLVETGELREDDRVELIEGEIVPMSPIGSAHVAVMNRLMQQFRRLPAEQFFIACQSPIALGDESEPEPDFSILQPKSDFYESGLPTAEDVLLLIEVMVSSHNRDLNTKRELYAKHGLAEVWFVDVPGRLVHVCREPRAEGHYNSTEVNSGQAKLQPLFAPSLQLELAELLGPVAKPS
ncbi:MAG: Uma2 family endonuclease [Rubinisphaera brasiliensis]|uniref:Uma2 family endonuclease n=1 Tax=Rubinisphaera brasiliensis TaxID=119 RepID=UPI00391A2FBB